MKIRSLTLFPCCLFISSAIAIPWPLGDGATGWESVYPITRTFGNYDRNLFWTEVNSTFDMNFHNAIDLSFEDANTENIRAVEAGVFQDCQPFDSTGVEWFAQIFPTDSTYGWHYGHVQGDDGNPLRLDAVRPGIDTASYGDLLGTMAEIGPSKHLHFFRTDQLVFQNGAPGVDNPLDFLYPPPKVEFGYSWCTVTSNPALFFLPQHDAIYGNDSWEKIYHPPTIQNPGGDPLSVLSDTLDRNGLFGAVDILFGCKAIGYPTGSPVEDSGIPRRIDWSLFKETASGEQKLFTKYLVDFDGIIGAAPGDWQQFKRFYFPYFADYLFYDPGNKAYIICLTNCNDVSFPNGISNIEENCWQTDVDLQSTGTALVPSQAQYPDGNYRIQIHSYSCYGSPNEFNEDVTVDNFYPHVNSVTVYNNGTEIYEGSYSTPNPVPHEVREFEFDYCPREGSGHLEALILFSEPVVIDSIWIEGKSRDIVNWTSPMIPVEPERVLPRVDGQAAYAFITVEEAPEGYLGELTLSIRAHDLGTIEHELDANPITIPYPHNSNPSFIDNYYEPGIAVFKWNLAWHAAKTYGNTDIVYGYRNMETPDVFYESSTVDLFNDPEATWFYPPRSTIPLCSYPMHSGQCTLYSGYWLRGRSWDPISYDKVYICYPDISTSSGWDYCEFELPLRFPPPSKSSRETGAFSVITDPQSGFSGSDRCTHSDGNYYFAVTYDAFSEERVIYKLTCISAISLDLRTITLPYDYTGTEGYEGDWITLTNGTSNLYFHPYSPEFFWDEAPEGFVLEMPSNRSAIVSSRTSIDTECESLVLSCSSPIRSGDSFEITVGPAPEAGSIFIRLYDISGRCILSLEEQLSQGQSNIIIPNNGNAVGMYYIQLEIDNMISSRKVLIID